MADPRHMTTGEAAAFRDGLRRGVEIALEAAARRLDECAVRHSKLFSVPADYDDRDCGAGAGEIYATHHTLREAAAAIRAMDASTLGVGE